MNVIDIIAIIPYFITLATVIAEEEDTLNLPKAPVSPQVFKYNLFIKNFQLNIFIFFNILGQVNESGYVLGYFTSDTISSSISNI